METIETLTIDAREACLKAFEANPTSEYAWCCHHEVLFEKLDEPSQGRTGAQARIQFISSGKDAEEHLLRFNNFRPVTGDAIPLVAVAVTEIARLENEKDTEYFRRLNAYRMADAPTVKKTRAFYESIDAMNEQYRAAQRSIEAPLIVLYKQQVPLGTWTGKTIFPDPIVEPKPKEKWTGFDYIVLFLVLSGVTALLWLGWRSLMHK